MKEEMKRVFYKKLKKTLTIVSAIVTMVLIFAFSASAQTYTYTVTNGAVYNVEVGDTVYLSIADSSSGMIASAYYWYQSGGDGVLEIEKNYSLATITFERGGTAKLDCGLNGTVAVQIPQRRYNSFTKTWDTYYTYDYYSRNYDYQVTFNIKDDNPPRITRQPVDVTVAQGKKCTVDFGVYSGLKPLKYTWYYAEKGSNTFKKATTIKGRECSVTMDKSKDGRKVYCVVTDSKGQKTKTKTVTIRMADKVKITKQPVNKTVIIGDKTSVSLKASGTGKLKYTWYYADKGSTKFKKSSVTSSTYSLTMTKARSGRRVYCVVKDAYGQSAKSKTVTLTLSKKVGITKQPESVTVKKGAIARTKVEAYSGYKPLKYTWYYAEKGSSKYKKSSVTVAEYTVKMTADRSGRKIYCVVTDAKGNKAKSNTVTLKMAAPLKITTQPKSVIVAEGNVAKVSLKATGSGKLTYRWYMKSPDSDGYALDMLDKKNSYSMELMEYDSGAKVYCVVKDAYGQSVKSKVVTLKVAAPIVINNTYTETNSLGQVISQTVEAEGEGKLTYTWYKSYGGGEYTKIKNNNSKKLTLIDDENYNTAIFVYCEISDKYGQTSKTDLVIFNWRAIL